MFWRDGGRAPQWLMAREDRMWPRTSSQYWPAFQVLSRSTEENVGLQTWRQENEAAFFKINEFQAEAIFSHNAQCFLKCQENSTFFLFLCPSLSFDFPVASQVLSTVYASPAQCCSSANTPLPPASLMGSLLKYAGAASLTVFRFYPKPTF